MLIDSHNRVVDYLRVSVTQRCNFRCLYCMPEKPFSWMPKEDLLSYEELFAFIKICIDQGVKKIRLTGGEPLIRKDLDKFIKMINDYKNDIDLALTTNAFYLSQKAQELKDAGLKRVNISLDSLKRDVLAKIAQKDVLPSILEGIQKADEVGLKIKINCVPMKGINENELLDILDFCKDKGYAVRFIEYMENENAKFSTKGYNSLQIQEIIGKKYNFKKCEKTNGSPSQDYILEDGYIFGIIEPHKEDFCTTCNRIRLTADGVLIPCLYFEDSQSVKEAVQKKDMQKAEQILKSVVAAKPEKNKWSEEKISSRAFYETGG